MNKLWKLVILCTGCLCLTAADSALADYTGLVHVTKADEDTVNLCNNAEGDDVPEPLDVCNVLAQFTNPEDRLLSVGCADISASNGLFYQHPNNFSGSPSPACGLIPIFPDVICDSFVTIGYKCGPSGEPEDGTATDGDFSADEFNDEGHIIGGWFNAAPPNGQGDAGTDPPNQNLQVLFLQVSVPTGDSVTGCIDVFTRMNNETVAFLDQQVACFGDDPVECPLVGGCEGPEDCDDENPCTDDDCIEGDCVNTPDDANSCDDGDFCNGEETCTDGVCNSSGDPCKGGEECNATCNPDAGNCFDLDGESCGDPATECSGQDTCDGAGACQDNDADAGDPCGEGPSECSGQDTCDGAGACLDNDADAGDPCGEGPTECSGQDTCDGAGACQDNDADAGDPCGEGPTECSGQDTCDGAGACQDNHADAGDSCGEGPTECSGQDTCDGAGACQDNHVDAGDSCGDGPTECSGQDTCDGAGACQANDADAGDLCGDQNVECLVDDTCDGAGECTDNGIEDNGTPCGDGDECLDGVCEPVGPCPPGEGCNDGNDCTADDTCDEDGNCVGSPVKNGTPCGSDSDTECDDADSCLGGVCEDNNADAGAECGDQNVDCLVDDTCDGAGECTDNGIEDDGTPCGDGDECLDGVCEPVGPCPPGEGCNDGNDCTADDTCDEDGNCVGSPVKNGTPCGSSDSSECDAADSCLGGACQDNNADAGDPCGDQGVECLEDDTCNGTGGCTDNGNQEDGSECNDDDDCTTDDVCSGGSCAGDDLCEPGEVCVDGECFEVDELELPLDIEPRKCPNIVMRDTSAAVWAALLGTEDFDITQVRMSTLLLSRADGVGGSLVPTNRKFKDEGTPFEGELCNCHAVGKDQITDLRMKFKTDAMVAAFQLNDEPSGSTIELIVTGQLNDGMMIFGRDCILLVR